MPKKPLTLEQEVESVESLMHRRQVLETDKNLKIAEFREKIEAKMADIRRRIQHDNDTTGDRIRDYVLLHRGVDHEQEEWYRSAQARLRGHGGQVVMTCLVRMESHGPLIRRIDEGRVGVGKSRIAEMGPIRKLIKYYQLAVLTG
jgi:hypothetical protein